MDDCDVEKESREVSYGPMVQSLRMDELELLG